MSPAPTAVGRAVPFRDVLVTGGTGFVGGAVARALLAAGHRVTALVRDPERAADLAAAGASLVAGDMTQPRTYVDLVDGVDAVVHAAQLRVSGRLGASRLARMHEADRIARTALATACLATGARMVYTGGAFVYGDHADRWIDERTPHRPAPLGAGHAAGVRDLRMLADRGLDLVVVYPGFVYGPGGTFREALYEQARAGRLRVIGDGGNYWSCVRLDDLAAGYLAALERGSAGEEFNLVDDEPLPMREFFGLVGRGLGMRRVGSVPRYAAGLLLGGPVTASLTTSYRVANRLARERLGWHLSAPTVTEGLPDVLGELGGRGRGSGSARSERSADRLAA